VANVTPQASAPPATARSAGAFAADHQIPRTSPRAGASHERRAARRRSSQSLPPRRAVQAPPTSSPASRAAAYANTPWPLAITSRMTASDQGSTRSGPAGCSWRSLSGGWSHPPVGWPALALLAAVAGWSSERRAAAAAERWLAACCSVASASARRLSSNMTWLATAVTLGSSRRAWNTSRARSCPSTRRCTGSGLPGFQERPALTAALARALLHLATTQTGALHQCRHGRETRSSQATPDCTHPSGWDQGGLPHGGPLVHPSVHTDGCGCRRAAVTGWPGGSTWRPAAVTRPAEGPGQHQPTGRAGLPRPSR